MIEKKCIVCLFVSDLISKFATDNILILYYMDTKVLTLDKYLFEDAQKYAKWEKSIP